MISRLIKRNTRRKQNKAAVFFTIVILVTGFCDRPAMGYVVAASKYVSIDEAADTARKQVYNHTSDVTVYFKTTISSPDEAYATLKQKICKITSDSSEGDYMLWDIKKETPQYAYTYDYEEGTLYYYYKFDISYTYYTTINQRNQVDRKVKQIIESFNFTDNTSKYKKIKAVYDYVCKNVDYASDTTKDIAYTSYSALYNGYAVCQGYAQLIYKMLKELNIQVRLIPGYSNNQLHGWNIVKIGSYYYNIDATWDAGYYNRGLSYRYFLKGDSFDNHVRFSEYATSEFYSAYPMAANEYGSGKAKISNNSKAAKFKVIKPKILSVKGRRIKLGKVSGRKWYIVKYSENKKFKNATILKTKSTRVNLKNAKNRKYYVRYRAAKVIGGKTVYTKWSAKKVINKLAG